MRSFVAAIVAATVIGAAAPAAAAGTVIYSDEGTSDFLIFAGLALPGAGVYHVQITNDQVIEWGLRAFYDRYHTITAGPYLIQAQNNETQPYFTQTNYGASFTFEIPQTEHYFAGYTSGGYYSYLGIPDGLPIYDNFYYNSPSITLVGYHTTFGGDINYSVQVTRFEAVPEPATWAMMLLGFGGIGAVIRRRQASLAA